MYNRNRGQSPLGVLNHGGLQGSVEKIALRVRACRMELTNEPARPIHAETTQLHDLVGQNSSALSIGYFSPAWPLDAAPNGIIAYVADMADQLKKMGHRISIVTTRVVGETQDSATYSMQQVAQGRGLVQRILDGAIYRISAQWFLERASHRYFLTIIRQAIAEQGMQIFEMEEAFGRAIWVREVCPILLCVRLHGPWFLNGKANGIPEDRAFRQRVIAEGRAIADANAISSSSQDVLERTRAYYNLALRDAEVIYPPSHPVPPAQQWRREECNPNEVLFIGRFDRHKGADLVIEAFGRVLREIPDAHLSFVGPDPGLTDADGRTWHLESFVRDRLPGAIESGQITLLGQQPFSALTALRRKAMVTTICSRYENAPRALIEAMSLGCPIVAARVGGIPEILEDQRDGLLHRPEDSDDLAAQIISLLKNPARSAELGHGSRSDMPGADSTRRSSQGKRSNSIGAHSNLEPGALDIKMKENASCEHHRVPPSQLALLFIVALMPRITGLITFRNPDELWGASVRVLTGDLSGGTSQTLPLINYLNAASFVVLYALGRLVGVWHTLADFRRQYFSDPTPFIFAGRFVAASLAHSLPPLRP